MEFFELEPSDISNLNDADLREMVARLCEAELVSQGIRRSCVMWGGAQEAADGGLDVRVADATSISNPIFVMRANTGFQVKKNSMSKALCKKEMLDKGRLKSVIEDLRDKSGSYVIVSGKDDCSDLMLSERISGMKSAVHGLANRDKLLLDFYGRDRLCSWLRQFPSVALWVRSRLGKPLSGWKPFGKWASSTTDTDDDFLMDEHPCVIDFNSPSKAPVAISDGINLVRKRLLNTGSAVRITGLSGVGKTRFAQALFEDNVCENALSTRNVIYADLGEDLAPSAYELISYLIANDFSSYLVLDNCPPDVHRKLQKQVSSNQAKVSLLTIEYDISDDHPEETEVIHLEPFSEQNVATLIQKKFPDLGRVNANKIAEFSGGNARVAIALASRVSADETLANFSNEDLFQRLFNQRKEANESLLESAEILSLVYSFNVSQQEFNDELSVLSRIGGSDRQKLNRHHAELLRRQLSQQRGNWRAILPHALANRLTKRALQNIHPDQINSELLKSDNRRLFLSCAHRLGYMHDFEPARNLVRTWMTVNGPFHNIELCDGQMLTALGYIAPVFPNRVLTAIEKASVSHDFCSRKNRNFSVFVRLLRKIAYDDHYFDRAVELILRFAETEKAGEKYDSIANQLASLFSLYLSGTQATPAKRQFFVSKILSSNESRQFEIAEHIFRSAFEVSDWGSCGSFDFGARSRDFGWEPKTNQERLDWYSGFIELLKLPLESVNQRKSRWAKELLAYHFVWLWRYADCFDILESIVRQYGTDGQWVDIWRAIKRTIHDIEKEYPAELLERLKKLERLTAPSDFYSDIEAYVLTNTFDHIEVLFEDDIGELEKIDQKIKKLGELASCDPECLEKLAPRLWEKDIDALHLFGTGLAQGSLDQGETFDILVNLMQKQNLEVVHPALFRGFIAGVYDGNPSLSRSLQESVLDVPELRQYFVYILSSTPILSWGTKRLIELVESRELEPWRLEQIKFRLRYEHISDNNLSKLLSALNNSEGGIYSTLQILAMRFHRQEERDYIPNDFIKSVAREAIFKLLSRDEDEINGRLSHGISRIYEECLSEPVMENEIREIVNLLCEGVGSLRIYGSYLEDLTAFLVKNYIEYFLDRVFRDEDTDMELMYPIFIDRLNRSSSPLNLAPIECILNWCNGNQEKIQKIASAVSVYVSPVEESQSLGLPKKVILSEHIMVLIDVAENKVAIVETIFDKFYPNSYSGSFASILETRVKAFSALLNHTSPEVREIAKSKYDLLTTRIGEAKEKEANESRQREQRFE